MDADLPEDCNEPSPGPWAFEVHRYGLDKFNKYSISCLQCRRASISGGCQKIEARDFHQWSDVATILLEFSMDEQRKLAAQFKRITKNVKKIGDRRITSAP